MEAPHLCLCRSSGEINYGGGRVRRLSSPAQVALVDVILGALDCLQIDGIKILFVVGTEEAVLRSIVMLIVVLRIAVAVNLCFLMLPLPLSLLCLLLSL